MGPGVPIKIKEDRNYMKMTYEKARRIIKLEKQRVSMKEALDKAAIESKDNLDSRVNTLKELELPEYTTANSWEMVVAVAALALESLPKKSNETDLR